ncbi:MAG: hypothetical protein LBT46_02660 [Planctomycetaceae bacterium]|nr:hypothetical protein [Planctomycetaceae bacterium]
MWFALKYRIRHQQLVSIVTAVVESKDVFQERSTKLRFDLGTGSNVSVLGDGAQWIWKMSEQLFGKTPQCLDVSPERSGAFSIKCSSSFIFFISCNTNTAAHQ